MAREYKWNLGREKVILIIIMWILLLVRILSETELGVNNQETKLFSTSDALVVWLSLVISFLLGMLFSSSIRIKITSRKEVTNA